eukprot:736284-Hanusia_phi.AAC.3
MEKLWRRAAFLVPLVLSVRAGLHQLPKMVEDEPSSFAKNRGPSPPVPSGNEAARSDACTAAFTESGCLRRSGCAWCVVKQQDEEDAYGIRRSLTSVGAQAPGQRDTRGQQLECGKWSTCVGPPGLCELRRDRKSCEKDTQLDVACAWCASEDRCVTYTSNASGERRKKGEGEEGEGMGGCVGCDGKFNSGMKTDVCGVCGGTNSTCFAFTRQEQIGILLALSGNILISVRDLNILSHF